MIQAVSDTCSVRWTKVNHKVYKFQSLVFGEDKNQIKDQEINPVNSLASPSPCATHSSNNEEKQVKQIINEQEETSACPSQSKITGPIQWKQVYGEYLGKEPDLPELIEVSPKVSRKSSETPPKIARKSPESPLLRHRKDTQDVQTNKEVIVKKDQRRVHFEDEVRIKCDDEDDVFEQPRKNCLADCSLCRTIPPRDFSPPYQALVEKSRHSNPNNSEKVD